MVRAGVVDHPSLWPYGTWPEFFGGRRRYRIADRATLLKRLEIPAWESFARWYKATLADMLCRREQLVRQPFWSSSIAVGDAEWLGNAARRSGLKRFEIREAGGMTSNAGRNVKSFFLGTANQCKID